MLPGVEEVEVVAGNFITSTLVVVMSLCRHSGNKFRVSTGIFVAYQLLSLISMEKTYAK